MKAKVHRPNLYAVLFKEGKIKNEEKILVPIIREIEIRNDFIL